MPMLDSMRKGAASGSVSSGSPHGGWLESWFAVPDPMRIGADGRQVQRFRAALQALPRRTGRRSITRSSDHDLHRMAENDAANATLTSASHIKTV
jgi:hypothetical protein